MNELIKVTEVNERQTVMGRDLHEFLEIETQYTDWMNKLIEKYEFIENTDFILVIQKKITNNSKNPVTNINNHQLKLEMAKEISMISNTEKGKLARKYFIECETKLKEVLQPSYKIPRTYSEALRQIADSEEEKQLLLQEINDKTEEVIITEKKRRANAGGKGGLIKHRNKLNKEIEEKQTKIDFLTKALNNLI